MILRLSANSETRMIYELKQPSSNVLAIDCPFPEALAVIEGNNPGWVFADDLNTPRTALVWAQGIEGFYLVGDTDSTVFLEHLNDYIDQVLKPRLRNSGATWFEVSGGENWNPVIESTFEKRNLESSQQSVYTLKPMTYKAAMQPETVGDCKLLRIDRHLLDFSASKEFLHSRLALFWGSENAFLKAGLGYVLMCGEEIASLCCSGFVSGNTHAIDIETEASHRRKGYAEAVAKAFIAECVERHFQPYWDCMAENVASAQLAEKLGFTRSHTYTLYSFPL
jgi:RimJ/RimL family protein N-acetyltransferase